MNNIERCIMDRDNCGDEENDIDEWLKLMLPISNNDKRETTPTPVAPMLHDATNHPKAVVDWDVMNDWAATCNLEVSMNREQTDNQKVMMHQEEINGRVATNCLEATMHQDATINWETTNNCEAAMQRDVANHREETNKSVAVDPRSAANRRAVIKRQEARKHSTRVVSAQLEIGEIQLDDPFLSLIEMMKIDDSVNVADLKTQKTKSTFNLLSTRPESFSESNEYLILPTVTPKVTINGRNEKKQKNLQKNQKLKDVPLQLASLSAISEDGPNSHRSNEKKRTALLLLNNSRKRLPARNDCSPSNLQKTLRRSQTAPSRFVGDTLSRNVDFCSQHPDLQLTVSLDTVFPSRQDKSVMVRISENENKSNNDRPHMEVTESTFQITEKASWHDVLSNNNKLSCDISIPTPHLVPSNNLPMQEDEGAKKRMQIIYSSNEIKVDSISSSRRKLEIKHLPVLCIPGECKIQNVGSISIEHNINDYPKVLHAQRNVRYLKFYHKESKDINTDSQRSRSPTIEIQNCYLEDTKGKSILNSVCGSAASTGICSETESEPKTVNHVKTHNEEITHLTSLPLEKDKVTTSKCRQLHNIKNINKYQKAFMLSASDTNKNCEMETATLKQSEEKNFPVNTIAKVKNCRKESKHTDYLPSSLNACSHTSVNHLLVRNIDKIALKDLEFLPIEKNREDGKVGMKSLIMHALDGVSSSSEEPNDETETFRSIKGLLIPDKQRQMIGGHFSKHSPDNKTETKLKKEKVNLVNVALQTSTKTQTVCDAKTRDCHVNSPKHSKSTENIKTAVNGPLQKKNGLLGAILDSENDQ